MIDLTHPFAIKITSALSKVCTSMHQPFIRYERPIENFSNAFLIKEFSDLCNYDLKNKSILFAVGVRYLQDGLIFARGSGANVYARILANPVSIRKTLSSSINKTNYAGSLTHREVN